MAMEGRECENRKILMRKNATCGASGETTREAREFITVYNARGLQYDVPTP